MNTLLVHGGYLMVGGEFENAGGAPANKIASWDGSHWNPLNQGFNGGVRDLVENTPIG